MKHAKEEGGESMQQQMQIHKENEMRYERMKGHEM